MPLALHGVRFSLIKRWTCVRDLNMCNKHSACCAQEGVTDSEECAASVDQKD